MASHRTSIADDLSTLFGHGTLAGLSDSQLLERYVSGHDELAFRGLVARHGPMVLGVCRRLLPDSHEAEDAFQATFLVLARKAGSIRRTDCLSTWLYGVAFRVARRQREVALRFRTRKSPESECAIVPTPDMLERSELASALEEEIARLPRQYRSAVVLCYVEGQTHEDAARRLQWPLGTVKTRLGWARRRLQSRLVCRGVCPAGILFSEAHSASKAHPPVPPQLLDSTHRLIGAASGTAGAGVIPGPIAEMARETLKAMFLSKLKVSAILLAVACFVGSGAAVILGQGVGKDARAPAIKANPQARKTADAPTADNLRRLANDRVEIARQRLDAQMANYRLGRITVDRYIAASVGLMNAESETATSKEGRIAAVRAHRDRLGELAKWEKAELDVGRWTMSDLLEVRSGLSDAEFLLEKESRREPTAIDELKRRLDDLERRLDQGLKKP